MALSLVAVVNIIGQFATVPLVLRYWDRTRYGEWVWLTGFITFLMMADLGVQSHVVNQMSAHHARDDHDALLADLHSAMRVQVPISAGLWTIGAVVAAVLPLDDMLGVSSVSAAELYLTVLLLTAEVLVCMPMGVVGGIYRATGRLPRSAMTAAVQRAVLIVIPLSLVAAGAGFAAVALFRVVWAIAVSLWIVRDLSRIYSWFHVRPLGGSWKSGIRMLLPSSLFLALALTEYLATQGNIAVVQWALGGGEVAQFSTHRTMSNMGRLATAQLTVALWPELTALDARSESARLIRVHRSLSKVSGFLVGGILLAFIPVSEWIYAAWTLRKLSLDPITFSFMVAQTILWSVWSSSATLLAAINRQGRLALVLLVNAGAAVALSLFLVPRMGIRGAALASLLADVACAAWAVPWTACNAIGDRFAAYARSLVPALLLGLGIPVLFGLLLWRTLPEGPLRHILVPVAAGLPALALMWVALAPPERQLIHRILDLWKVRFTIARQKA
jgi:O-antigen/teichoic acid export membrane protein